LTLAAKNNIKMKTKHLVCIFLFFFFLAFQACNKTKTRPQVTVDFAFSADITLNPEEIIAEVVFDSLRKDLLNRINGQLLFSSLYSGWRNEVLNEPLYMLFKAMPKGALLHVHASAVGDAEWIINKAAATSGCCIFLGNESLGPVCGQLGIAPYQTVTEGWIPMDEYIAQEPDWQSTMHKWFTIGPEDEQAVDIWDEFERTFQRVDGFISYSPVFSQYYTYSFKKMAADGIGYVEMRTSLDGLIDNNGQWIEDEYLISIYNSIVEEVRAIYPEFALALIVNGWRGDTKEGVLKQVERANTFYISHTGFIAGFDLVGEEEAWNSNGYYAQSLSQIIMPLFLHGGESLLRTNHNISDALDLHAKRIAHAINLVYFPELENEICNNDILLELCPLSNQALRYTKNLADHPGKGYLKRGVQATLGSDDPALFGTESLTDDYFIAYLAWNLDLRSIKKLIINSINYSGMSQESKEIYLVSFNELWNLYIRNIVENKWQISFG